MRAAAAAVLFTAIALLAWPEDEAPGSPIRFSCRRTGFLLENCETEMKYAPETMAGGVAVFDYDNDGDLDIFFANGAEMPGFKKSSPKYWNRLLANDGRGNFTDVTERAGLAGTGYDTGVAVADYDNDGDLDLFVGGVHRSALYRNNGDGTFNDVTAQAGLDKPDPEYGPLWSVGGAWLDANNDGHLDLFVTNYLSWSPEKEPECLQNGKRDYCHPKYFKGTPNRLFLGNGDGTFTDASAASGIRAHPGKGMGAAIADHDLDGLVDIFVTNDKIANFLFHNLGNGRFREVAFEAVVAYPEHGRDVSGMGSDFRDLDNDGLPDIVFVALDNETFPLFRNSGKGYFDEVTAASGLTRLSQAMAGYSPAIYDFDNDGWKDIFVSRGHVQSPNMEGRLEIAQHNTVFRNLGGIRMQALTGEAGFASEPRRRHRGSAHGDLNNDGRVDIVVSALSAPAEIWLNESPGNRHWLALKLTGSKSNRDGIGARIRLTARQRVQYNHVTTAVGYASSSAGPVHFGLGAAAVADEIEIRWPSGIVQRLTQVKGDRVVEVKEPAK
ncbi:MAG: CRTAC1 family protein [Bryobacteraceae bacterium]|nr:CRTAC1 family protein [Bryobacteraceae bacterium]